MKKLTSPWAWIPSLYFAEGIPYVAVMTISVILYKQMGLKDKLPTMSEDEQLQLLASDGMLVKRPLVIYDGGVLVGFKAAEYDEKL